MKTIDLRVISSRLYYGVALLTFLFSPLSGSAQNVVLSNLWSIEAGTQPFLTTTGTDRGLAYNPATGHVLLATRAAGAATTPAAVMVLDSETGSAIGNLSIANLVTSGTGMIFNMNMINVADDGVIYACNLANVAIVPTNNFVIYRWQDESSDPTIAYHGNLDLNISTALSRFGDSFDVRGSGTNTMIIAGQGVTGQRFAILTTTDGTNFSSKVFTNAAASNGDFYRGLTFGSGNTFFSKNTGSANLRYSTFDLAAGTTSFLQTYTVADNNLAAMGFNVASNLLVMIRANATASTNQYVNLYSVSTNQATPPALLDTKRFVTNLLNGNIVGAVDFGGDKVFALNVQNGIMAFRIMENVVVNPPVITVQPTNQTVYAGAPLVVFAPGILGTQPLFYQWFKDNVAIPTATNATYSLTNLTTNMAGAYSLTVSNSAGSTTTSNAILKTLVPFNTAQMSNVWNLLPNSRPYLGDTDSERGLAYNPATTNLLLVSRATTNNIIVLDALTGSEKHFLNVDPFTITPTGGAVTFNLSKIGISDDGVVYAANLVAAGNATSFRIYSWANDSATAEPQLAFIGDPGAGSNLRWGDSMAVRGAGADTQILLTPGSGTTVSLIKMSPDGVTLDQTPVVINATDSNPLPNYTVPVGIAFGAGNSFWAKLVGSPLRQIEFDPVVGFGSVSRYYSFAAANTVPTFVSAIAVDTNKQFLAGVAFENPDNVRLYSIADLDAGPVLRDQELFATDNANGNSLGAAIFGGDYLFALNSNNGIKAFLINTNYVPPVVSFAITSIAVREGTVVVTWQSVAGQSYQVQSKESLSELEWTNLGPQIQATGSSTSFTNELPASTRFYKIRAL